MMLNLYIKKGIAFTLVFIISILIVVKGYSQDIANIKVDQLSDEQVRQIVKKAEASGMTQQNLETAAIAKGMPAIEVQKLRDRILKLNNSGSSSFGIDNSSRARTYIDGSNPESSLQRNTASEDPFDAVFFKQTQAKDDPELKSFFGFDLFNTKNLTFEPSLSIATPVNYQLGAGDEILIDIWGASQQNYRLTVSPEGSVFIDNVGPVNVNGLTIDKAQSRIINRLSTIYSGLKGSGANTFAQVSIGNIRSINVTLLGEVRLPGSYTLSSLATVFNALYISGGPSKNGSLRNIEIFRDNKLLATLDVYDFLISGDQKNNIRLQDQDVIKINPYLTRFELKGEFKRPFIYEAKAMETLSDVIKYAGGFTDKAYTHRLRIERKTSRERSMADVQDSEFDKFIVNNGDKIIADSILVRYENRVGIMGAVYRPGQYQITEGLTLKDLINKAEGMRGDAFLTRAILYRMLPDLTIRTIPIDLSALINKDSGNIKIIKDDLFKVFSIFDLQEEYSLQIDGEVLSPGKFPFVYSMSLADLIAEAGGFKESASQARIEIARRVKNSDISSSSASIADIFQFTVSKDLRLSDSASHFELAPFDRVFIRRSPGYEVQTVVSIKGEALYPGAYSIINKDERISDLLKRAGGLTKEAYAKGARFTRKLPINVAERQKILRAIQSDSNDSLKFQVSNETEQSIGIDLDRIMENPLSKYDLILQDGDILEIPKELQTVRLSGAFLYPITVRYDKSMSLKKYASMAGGFSEDAKPSKAFVIYANGSVDRTSNFLWMKIYPKVEPGAEIIVPKKMEGKKMSPQEILGLSTAMTSLALIIVTIVGKL